jgi:cell volume regulation protein A
VALNVEGFLLLVSATLFLSYISSLIYSKTKIPDIVWLLGLGYILGPVLNFFRYEDFIKIFEYLILVVVGLFSFDTGINVNISSVMRNVVKALTLSATTFIAIIAVVGYTMHYLMPSRFPLLDGMLLGAMIGGLGGISVTGILDRLKTLIPSVEKDGVVLNLESTLSDTFRLVAVFTLYNLKKIAPYTIEEALKEIVWVFTIATIFGIVVGLLWSEVLDFLWARPFNYIMTIAALFPVYIFSERYIGNAGGAITALAFGLAVNNHNYLYRVFGWKRRLKVNKFRIREFNQEITFLVKAFFFVYIGLIVSLSVDYAILGAGVVALMLATRYAVATGVGGLLRFSVGEKVLSRLIFLQGTSALVMSQLPRIWDPEMVVFADPNLFSDLCYPIVIITLVFVSILGPVIARRQLRDI